MLTVITAAADIAGAAWLAITQTSRVGVVAGEYLIIELCICVAIGCLEGLFWSGNLS